MHPLWLILLLLFAFPAKADDAMDAQRCIWRCAAATGSAQPAYNQCIKKKCDGEQPKKRKPKTGWRDDLNTSTQASVSTKSNDGRHRLDVMCDVGEKGIVYTTYIEKLGKRSRIAEGSGNLFADREMFPVNIGGIEGGWSIENHQVGNRLSMSPPAIEAIGKASEILLMSGTVEVEPAAAFTVQPNSPPFGRFVERCQKLGPG